MEFKAGERLRMVRELMDLTQKEFAQETGLNATRIKNLEQFKVRVSELEYDAVAETYPELVAFFAHEGLISENRLRTSSNPRVRLIMSLLDAGDLAENKAIRWIK